MHGPQLKVAAVKTLPSLNHSRPGDAAIMTANPETPTGLARLYRSGSGGIEKKLAVQEIALRPWYEKLPSVRNAAVLGMSDGALRRHSLRLLLLLLLLILLMLCSYY